MSVMDRHRAARYLVAALVAVVASMAAAPSWAGGGSPRAGRSTVYGVGGHHGRPHGFLRRNVRPGDHTIAHVTPARFVRTH